MVVLADPLLEAFFDVDLPRSFRLTPMDPTAKNQVGLGLLGNVGGFLSSFVTDDNKKIFNNIVDDMGKAIGKHQVCNSIIEPGLNTDCLLRSPFALLSTSTNVTWRYKNLCEKQLAICSVSKPKTLPRNLVALVTRLHLLPHHHPLRRWKRHHLFHQRLLQRHHLRLRLIRISLHWQKQTPLPLR
jgi:hypothetical protein